MKVGRIEVGRYRAGDETGIIDGLELASGRRIRLDEWAWRYPPSEAGRPIVVARAGGRVIAHLAAVPGRLSIDDAEYRAGVVVSPFVLTEAGDDAARAAVWSRVVAEFVAEFGPGRWFDVIFRCERRAAAAGTAGIAVGIPVASPSMAVLARTGARQSPVRRRAYRAEPARDWEPRLDCLWSRARGAYESALARDAEHALLHHAGHPTVRRHRFIAMPRFGRHAVAFAAFELRGPDLLWVDLAWDHAHPGALELLSHVSARLLEQLGASRELVQLSGDTAGRQRLARLGFSPLPDLAPPEIRVLAGAPALDLARIATGLYLTAVELEAG